MTFKFKDGNSTNSENNGNDNVPEVEVKDLPSKYLPYLDGARIFYKPYTYGEVKSTSQSNIGIDKKMERVLSGIEVSGESVVETDLKPVFTKYDITLSDFMFLGLLRKLSTLGESDYSLKLKCRHCKNDIDKVINGMDIEFEDLGVPELPLSVVVDAGIMHFSPITIGKYIELLKQDMADDTVALMAQQCTNMAFKDAYDVIYNLPANDSGLIDKIDSLLYHGIKPLEVKCDNCSQTNLVEVEGGDTIIYPFRRGRETFKDRIRFGLQDESEPATSK